MANPGLLRLCVAALLVAAPALACAAVRPWLSGDLGASTYAMGDVNDDIGEINSALAGSGLKMDEITGGLNYGFAFGLDVGSGFSVGLGYDHLSGKSEIGDYSGSIEYDMPANLWRGFGRYTFKSTGKAGGFLEASLGRVMSAGSVTLAATGFGSDSAELQGSGLALEVAGGVSYWVSPQFALTGSAGFRHASVQDVEVDGSPIYNTSGGAYSIDYTGLFARLGVTVVMAN